MDKEMLARLVDPVDLRPLTLRGERSRPGGAIETGVLEGESGDEYPVIRGIPRFVLTEDADQIQTRNAFAYKWRKTDTYDSDSNRQNSIDWCLEKYGFSSLRDWAECFAGRGSILDVGCGSGYSSSLWLDSPFWSGQATWVGADISEAVDVAQSRLGGIPNTHFVQADVMQLPFPDESFDLLFSEGVLHHTPSTRNALRAATRVLARGGEFHFYVYATKGPIREFTDDFVRERLEGRSEDEAWDVMRQFTTLGKVLSELETEVDLPEGVPILGIGPGRHDVQRLFYWNVAKIYWNDRLSFEENVHVNYDWYRPRYAHRQTRAQVERWCDELGLRIRRFHEQESGFSVIAVRS